MKPRLITLIPVLLAISGAFLIVYGFVMGANLWGVVLGFILESFPVSDEELYVIVGIVRMLFAYVTMKHRDVRVGVIVYGSLLVFSSIGLVFIEAIHFVTAGTTAFNIYVIAIDVIVMFPLSLFYLVYTFKRAKNYRQY